MPLALSCVSHSPLLDLPGPPRELLDDIGSTLASVRSFALDWDPELIVVFAPDHFNGFFYKTMPPFCIGAAASGVGDYGTQSGPLDVPEALAHDCAQSVLDSGVDTAVSESMDVDHAVMQPLQKLFGDARARPVLPVFVNSVAVPLGPVHRVRLLGAAIGRYLSTLGKRVLLLGSGGLAHDPPVPTLATATGPVRERIVHGGPQSVQQRQSRQTAVIEAAQSFAAGESDLRPLNSDFDRQFLATLDQGRLDDLDTWTNSWIASQGGNSAHEIRTWVAAFGALASQGSYRTLLRYYRPAPELITGFAARTALTEGDRR